ncbi:hypothetical protein J7E70_02375 [Variovorax paradoxus]|nr:hypothetical protein [Variovorax paradoxus]MBT2299299.1 hypothetical protein [Variovorax paradoxus]
MRTGGRWLIWNQKPKPFEGTLLSTRKGTDERKVPALFIGGMAPDGPTLYEPRVVSVLGNEMRIVGLEKCDSAWVLQEWSCEILSIQGNE